jgi:uncharacterized protein YaiI (UPF0178 family)
MRIWVDADATPRPVKDIIFRASKRLDLPTVLVSNQRLVPPADNPHVSTVRVAFGPDVADHHIHDNSDAGDVAITADIPLAAVLVEKGLHVLDPRGEVYTHDNIRERLSIRDFMDSLRSDGVETGGPKAYGNREKQAFASALDRILTRLQRRARSSTVPEDHPQ